MTSARYEIIFTGRVQGVFFRATAQEIARRFTITGWVRNEPDGSVRCLAEGEPTDLDQFVIAIQKAKQSNIKDTKIIKLEATDEFNGFTVRS